MTKEEIQALIDAKIAGQGSAVDAGGALPAILSEILDLATQSPEVPHAIQLSGPPETSMTTVAELAEIGLTASEFEAAAKGERTGVIVGGIFYPILGAGYSSAASSSLHFGAISIGSSGVETWTYWGIEILSGIVEVSYYEL